MNAIIVDDERLSICALEDACREIPEITLLQAFTNPFLVSSYVQTHAVDVAFLDIEMPGIDGISLAKELRKKHEELFIVFITGFKEYAFEAFGVDAVGYIMKPFVVQDIQKIVSKISRLKGVVAKRRITVRTFGYFDIFVNDVAVTFKSDKAKELLALLVDQRGATVTMEHAIDTLWPEERYDDRIKVKYRKASMYLKKDLQAVGLEDLMIASRAKLCINCKLFDCDYYRFLDGDGEAIINFSGEYMFQYSWAEITLARLESIKEVYLSKLSKKIKYPPA